MTNGAPRSSMLITANVSPLSAASFSTFSTVPSWGGAFAPDVCWDVGGDWCVCWVDADGGGGIPPLLLGGGGPIAPFCPPTAPPAPGGGILLPFMLFIA